MKIIKVGGISKGGDGGYIGGETNGPGVYGPPISIIEPEDSGPIYGPVLPSQIKELVIERDV